ncbi:MAG: hypothetical protein IT236_02510 [Bacteroidia bacterium]|nr:hypothetical protein [Bacteroidia bacterium]
MKILLMLPLFLFFSCQHAMLVNKGINKARTTMLSDECDGFKFYFQKNSLGDSARPFIKKQLIKYKQEILTIMAEKTFTPGIEAFFYSSKEQMNQALDTKAEGISFASKKVIAFVFSRQFSSLTRHEISHILSKNLWGASEIWIEEGFATLTDEDMQKQNFHQQCKALIGTPDFIDAYELFNHFNSFGGNWNRYVEAASILKFIKDAYGNDGLKEIWKKKRLQLKNKSEKQLLKEWMSVLENTCN